MEAYKYFDDKTTEKFDNIHRLVRHKKYTLTDEVTIVDGKIIMYVTNIDDENRHPNMYEMIDFASLIYNMRDVYKNKLTVNYGPLVIKVRVFNPPWNVKCFQTPARREIEYENIKYSLSSSTIIMYDHDDEWLKNWQHEIIDKLREQATLRLKDIEGIITSMNLINRSCGLQQLRSRKLLFSAQNMSSYITIRFIDYLIKNFDSVLKSFASTMMDVIDERISFVEDEFYCSKKLHVLMVIGEPIFHAMSSDEFILKYDKVLNFTKDGTRYKIRYRMEDSEVFLPIHIDWLHIFGNIAKMFCRGNAMPIMMLYNFIEIIPFVGLIMLGNACIDLVALAGVKVYMLESMYDALMALLNYDNVKTVISKKLYYHVHTILNEESSVDFKKPYFQATIHSNAEHSSKTIYSVGSDDMNSFFSQLFHIIFTTEELEGSSFKCVSKFMTPAQVDALKAMKFPADIEDDITDPIYSIPDAFQSDYSCRMRRVDDINHACT